MRIVMILFLLVSVFAEDKLSKRKSIQKFLEKQSYKAGQSRSSNATPRSLAYSLILIDWNGAIKFLVILSIKKIEFHREGCCI